jgi:hypothetical protein
VSLTHFLLSFSTFLFFICPLSLSPPVILHLCTRPTSTAPHSCYSILI